MYIAEWSIFADGEPSAVSLTTDVFPSNIKASNESAWIDAETGTYKSLTVTHDQMSRFACGGVSGARDEPIDSGTVNVVMALSPDKYYHEFIFLIFLLFILLLIFVFI